MAWKFTPDRPVYLQIAQRITKSVLSGEYAPGQQIPSIRSLAQEAAVNPNTVQHAFTQLENDGIIIPKGTLGRYVTDDIQTIEACRRNTARELVKEFRENLSQLSITPEQAAELMKEAENEYS